MEHVGNIVDSLIGSDDESLSQELAKSYIFELSLSWYSRLASYTTGVAVESY